MSAGSLSQIFTKRPSRLIAVLKYRGCIYLDMPLQKAQVKKTPFFLWYIKNTIIPIEMILNTWSRLFLSKGQNAKEAFTEVNYAHDSSKSSNAFWFVGIRTWNIWSCSIRPTWFIWCKIASMNTTTSCVLLGHHIRQNPVWGYKNRKNKTVESKHAEIALKRLRAHYE